MQPGLEAIAAVAVSQAGVAAGGLSQGATATGAFANVLQSKLQDLDTDVGAAEGVLRDLAAGKAVQPHEAMITLERARISVMTFLQVRNKLVESYQDLMRMQL